MASDAQNTLYDIFAGLYQHPGGGVGSGLAGSAAQAAAGSGSAAQAASEAASGGSGSGSTASGVGSKAGKFGKEALKNGLGLAGLVLSLFGVFDGGEDEAPPALVKYALPASREFEVAEAGPGFAAVDYDQAGMPRAYSPSRRQASSPQVNVTVQAMDARSFLDRSTEIAAAVREAMLNLNSINDVVNDL